jgi:uncharacterized protein
MKKTEVPKPEKLKDLARQRSSENLLLVKQLRKQRHGNLDLEIHRLHEGLFAEFDCLDCANCCKTISPIISYRDVDKLSKALGLKPGTFREEYLFEDEEGDFVFKDAPCPFLAGDHTCSVYESRPKACREYPHTNRKNMHQILDLCLKNTYTCPVVFAIFEQLRNHSLQE